MPFSGPKCPTCLEQIYFGKNHYCSFHLPVGPFRCAKFTKNSYSRSKVVSMHHFWAQNGSFALNKFFFVEDYQYHFHPTISPFHCAKFQKNLSSESRVVRMHNFWTQNSPFPQMRIFSENLLMNLVPFIHAYLQAKNQSDILIY